MKSVKAIEVSQKVPEVYVSLSKNYPAFGFSFPLATFQKSQMQKRGSGSSLPD